jgi:hypothetical protein
MDAEVAQGPRGLERAAADARGPLEVGHLRRILAGRQGGGVGLGRQDGQALGRGHGSGAADARGPLELGHLRRILAGRQGGGVGIGRRDGQALGRGHGSGAAEARAWYNNRNPFILYFGPIPYNNRGVLGISSLQLSPDPLEQLRTLFMSNNWVAEEGADIL